MRCWIGSASNVSGKLRGILDADWTEGGPFICVSAVYDWYLDKIAIRKLDGGELLDEVAIYDCFEGSQLKCSLVEDRIELRVGD